MRPRRSPRMEADPADAFRTMMPRYDAVLTYGGGPVCRATATWASARAPTSACTIGLDPETHYPVRPDPALACDVAFLGNRLPDREARVEALFFRAGGTCPRQYVFVGRRRLG